MNKLIIKSGSRVLKEILINESGLVKDYRSFYGVNLPEFESELMDPNIFYPRLMDSIDGAYFKSGAPYVLSDNLSEIDQTSLIKCNEGYYLMVQFNYPDADNLVFLYKGSTYLKSFPKGKHSYIVVMLSSDGKVELNDNLQANDRFILELKTKFSEGTPKLFSQKDAYNKITGLIDKRCMGKTVAGLDKPYSIDPEKILNIRYKIHEI